MYILINAWLYVHGGLFIMQSTRDNLYVQADSCYILFE